MGKKPSVCPVPAKYRGIAKLAEVRNIVRGLEAGLPLRLSTSRATLVPETYLEALVNAVDECPACGESKDLECNQDLDGEVGVKGRVIFFCQTCPFRWTFAMQEEIWNRTWIPSDPDDCDT
jgi:hypothetical protein